MKFINFSLVLYVLCIATSCCAMENKEEYNAIFNHNTYRGIPITPQTLPTLAPKMDKELEEVVTPWVNNNKEFLRELVTTPHPLTHANRKEKTKTNTELLAKNAHKIALLSTFNYVLKPTENDAFIAKINRWGSRMAYLFYATKQGSVLDDTFNADNADCSKIEYVKTYQHISNVAHWLRFAEIAEQKKFNYLHAPATHLVHIPGQPTDICDENYITVQQFTLGFVDLKALAKNDKAVYIETVKNLPIELLQEAHNAIKYSALWDFPKNLGITKEGQYSYNDLEEPFDHYPDLFFFQGIEGYKKYLKDVHFGLERMHKMLKEVDLQQAQKWKSICEKEDSDLRTECAKHGIEKFKE